MKKYYSETVWTRLFDVFNVLFMLVFMFLVLYPLWGQFIISIADTSKQTLGSLTFWPTKGITLDAYVKIFEDAKLLKGAFISVLRVVVGTASTLFCTGLLAYITTIRRFRGRNFVRRAFILTMYFGGGLIPFYLLMVNLKLLNTFWIYILPGLFSSYYMLLIASYIQNIPEALFEAARIDGCMEFDIYLKIVIPVCLPVLAAISVYLAVGHWNSWFDVMIYNPKGNWDTLQVYLRRILLQADSFSKLQESGANVESAARKITSLSIRAATTMVVTIPILCVYPFFQKFFISGITIGAVKQ